MKNSADLVQLPTTYPAKLFFLASSISLIFFFSWILDKALSSDVNHDSNSFIENPAEAHYWR